MEKSRHQISAVDHAVGPKRNTHIATIIGCSQLIGAPAIKLGVATVNSRAEKFFVSLPFKQMNSVETCCRVRSTTQALMPLIYRCSSDFKFPAERTVLNHLVLVLE